MERKIESSIKRGQKRTKITVNRLGKIHGDKIRQYMVRVTVIVG